MKQQESAALFDQSATKLLTMRDAAKYLGMHLMSIRRLVSWGRLRPRMRVGRTVMLAREDLDYYRATVGSTALPNPPPWIVNHLEASVIVKKKGKQALKKRLKGFSWEKIPFVKKQIAKTHGDVPFEIQVEAFDDSRWKLSYSPHKKTGRLWKQWAGDTWLVG